MQETIQTLEKFLEDKGIKVMHRFSKEAGSGDRSIYFQSPPSLPFNEVKKLVRSFYEEIMHYIPLNHNTLLFQIKDEKRMSIKIVDFPEPNNSTDYILTESY